MSKDIKVVIGENVKRYREEMGISMRALILEMGSSNNGYHMGIEKGLVNMKVDTLQRIADILDVSVLDLIEDWSEEE